MMTEGERRLERLVLRSGCDIDKGYKEAVAAVVCGVKTVVVWRCQVTEEQWRSVEERLETGPRKIETLEILDSGKVKKLNLKKINEMMRFRLPGLPW